MTEIGAIGNASARLGQNLGTTLTTPGLKQEDLDAKLNGYIQSAENQVQRAQDIDQQPPRARARGRSRGAAVPGQRARACRRSSTRRPRTPTRPRQGRTSRRRRSVCSRATWSGQTRSRTPPPPSPGRRGSTGSSRPGRVRQRRRAGERERSGRDLAADPGSVDRRHAVGPARQRDLIGEGAAGGQLLSTGTETTITVTDRLAFQVAVEDTGDSQEVQIKVTLTIPAQPDPIVRTATIPLIDPGETKTVTLKVGALVPFEEQTTVRSTSIPCRVRRTRRTTPPSSRSSSR